MVQVEPSDEERGAAHPRAGEVRFHGDRRSSPSFMPPRATARHPNVLREGDPSPGPPSQGAHIGGAAQLPALEAPPSAFRPSVFGDKGAQKGAQNGTTGERATEPSAPPYAFIPAQFLKQPDAEAPNLSDDGRARGRAREYSHYCDRLLLGCFRLFICLCLATVCLFLVRIDDALRTGGANTNFWITGTSVRSPPPPQLPAASSPPPPPLVSSPPPPPPVSSPTTPVSSPTTPVSSPTTPSTFVSSPAGLVEYSVLTWEPTYYEGYSGMVSCHSIGSVLPLPGSVAWWNPIVWGANYGSTRICGGSADTYRVTSDRSFVDIAKSKGVTNYDIFTTCSWPNVTQSVDDGSTHSLPPMADISYAQTTNTFGPTTTGHTWNGATVENRECVVEKLVNKYAESGWKLLMPPDANFASFSTNQRSYWFTRQNATSSLLTTSTSVSALTGPVEYKAVSFNSCLLYTSPSPRDRQKSRMPSSA